MFTLPLPSQIAATIAVLACALLLPLEPAERIGVWAIGALLIFARRICGRLRPWIQYDPQVPSAGPPQYSLAVLLLLTTGLAVSLAIHRAVVHTYQQQRQALAKVSRSLRVDFYPRPPWWCFDMVPEQYFQAAVSLRLKSTRPQDQPLLGLDAVGGFHGPQTVMHMELIGGGITDDQLRHLTAFEGLEKLTLTRTAVTSQGIVELRHALPGCRVLMR